MSEALDGVKKKGEQPFTALPQFYFHMNKNPVSDANLIRVDSGLIGTFGEFQRR